MSSAQLYDLTDYSLLLVKGPDAKKFLQGQVTCDIDTLKIEDKESLSSLGAHCSHKGRVLFTFRAIALDEVTIALLIPQSMMSIATTALGKYIVFSKADLIDASNDYQIIGLKGDSNAIHHAADTTAYKSIPERDEYATTNDSNILLKISDERYLLLLLKTESKEAVLIEQLLTLFSQEDQSLWKLENINACVSEILPETSDTFTPHAINFQVLPNAISFNKGCYTGQEVVARMHYLGKLKKQLFLFEYSPTNENHIAISVGDALYTASKEQSIGDIINIEKTEQGAYRLLASVSVEFAEANQVYLDPNGIQALNRVL